MGGNGDSQVGRQSLRVLSVHYSDCCVQIFWADVDWDPFQKRVCSAPGGFVVLWFRCQGVLYHSSLSSYFSGNSPKDSSGEILRARNVSPTLICSVFMFPWSLDMFTLIGGVEF